MKKHISKIIFFVIVIAYFIIYGFYGYNDEDDGFILALSWRVFNGEIPYKDFLLIRPPVSPLLHAIPLFIIPENFQVIFERFLFYIMVAVSSFFGSLSINRLFNLKKYEIDVFLLAAIGFVFSVSNFPPMPWHTIDGVFFASIGIFLLVGFSSSFSIVSGILMLFLSAMCKQSFFAMPIAGIIFVALVHKDWKKTILSILSLCIFVCATAFTFYELEALTNFVKFSKSSSNFKDLIKAGIFRYWNLNSIYFFVPIAYFLVLKKIHREVNYKKTFSYITLILLIFLSLFKSFYTKIIEKSDNMFFLRDDLSVILLVIGSLYIIYNYTLSKEWNGMIFMVLLSWSAGISWGYPDPKFFSVPLIFLFFLISKDLFNEEKIKRVAYFSLIIGIFVYFIAYQYPYHNPPRSKLNYELSEYFPKLGQIKVGQKCYEKYKDFYSLTKKYKENFKTLPGMPLSNYLTNTKSPMSYDWMLNEETANFSNYLISEMERKKVTVFMEKEPFFSITNNSSRSSSSVASFVLNNWIKIDSTDYFDIYISK